LSGAVTASAGELSLPIRINVGQSQAYLAQNGDEFLADQAWTFESGIGYVSGTALANGGESIVGGTLDRLLYKYTRLDWEEYRFSGIPNGDYVVTLHFNEQMVHGPALSLMDIRLEASLVLNDFDAFAYVGRDYALIRRFAVEVSDGELNVEAIPVVGQTHLAAISIDVHEPDTIAPTTPTGLTVIGGYGENLLDWADNPERDLNAYHVYRAPSLFGAYTRLTNEPVYISRYQDVVTAGSSYYYRVTALDLYSNQSQQSGGYHAVAEEINEAGLPVYELLVSEENLAQLYQAPRSDNYVEGTFIFEGQSYAAEVRFRGNTGRRVSKKNWKIRLNKMSPFFPQDRLNLNADFYDASFIRSELSMSLHEMTGQRVPQVEHALLRLNNHYMGVYSSYEQIDEAFLARSGRDLNSSIYKVGYAFARKFPYASNYGYAYEKETNRELGYDDLHQFINLIHETPDSSFAYDLTQVFDVTSYLNYYTALILVADTDFVQSNQYLIHDLERDYWEVIPWDADRSWNSSSLPIDMGTADSPFWNGSNPLLTRVLDVPQFRSYYCHRLTEGMNTFFSNTQINAQIDATYNRIKEPGLRDWLKQGAENNEGFLEAAGYLKAFARDRRDFLATQLSGYCPAEQAYLSINELMVNNSSFLCDPDDENPADCHEPWLELYNYSLEPINLQGLYFTDDLNQPTKYQISESLVVPALGHHIFWGDKEPSQGVNHLNFSLLPTGGTIALFAADGTTLLDSYNYSSQATNLSKGRSSDGLSQWRTFHVPTPSDSNLLHPPAISSFLHWPALPSANESVDIIATIIDDSPLLSAKLYYQVDGSGFLAILMTSLGSHRYTAELPPQPSGGRVQYYVLATDDDSGRSTAPDNAPESVQEYTVDYVPPALYINELMADNETGLIDPHESDEHPDWIEIYNGGPHVVDLGGMVLTDDLDNPTQFRISDELSIQPHGYLLFFADSDPEQGPQHTNFKLSSNGKVIALFDSDAGGNQLLSAYTFGPQEADVAVGRCPNGGEIWMKMPSASPNASNRSCGQEAPSISYVQHSPSFPIANQQVLIEATISDNQGLQRVTLWYKTETDELTAVTMTGNQNTYQALIPAQASGTLVSYHIEAEDSEGLIRTYPADELFLHYLTDYEPPPLYLNEFMALNDWRVEDPDEAREYPDWIELYHAGREPLDIGGYYLTDDRANPTQYRIPARTIISADGWYVLMADDDPEQGASHTNFTLSGRGEEIALYSPDGKILLDSYPFRRQNSVFSTGRSPDGDGNWILHRCITPGRANGCAMVYLPIISTPQND
jgi:spore coat protein CotH